MDPDLKRTSCTHSYKPVPSQYFWDDKSSIKLQTELQSPDSFNKLNMFNSQAIDIEDENSVNEVARNIERKIFDACDKSLKRPSPKKKKPRHRH